jgi:hypothetical protein
MLKSLLGHKSFARFSTLAAVLSLSVLGTLQAAQSEPQNPGQDTYRALLNQGATQLGINSSFGKTIQMFDKPGTLNFTWKTAVQGAIGGKWAVTDGPNGPTLKSGVVLPAPLPGKTGTFAIDFCKIAAPEAPEILKHYYVRIVPVNAKYQALGLPSDSVDISYLRSPKE